MKYTYPLIILVLIVVIFLQRECGNKPPPEPRIVTVYDTLRYTDTLYQPKPFNVVKYVYKDIHHYKLDTCYVMGEVDTIAILQDYFATVVYKDTILNDTNGIVTIYDTISENRIQSRSVHKRFYPTTYIIHSEKPPRTKVFVGLGVNGWVDKFGVSANIGLMTKRDHLYTLYYTPINQSVGFNIYWKIKIK